MGDVIDISQLPPEIQALVGASGTRSPIRQPLTDLREPRSQKERLHRPHFEFSVNEGDAKPQQIPPFPRLYWNERGQEVKILNEEDLKAKVRPGWTDAPPMANAISDQERLERELASLSPEDRAFVLEAERKQRLSRLQERLSVLTAEELATLGAAGDVESKRSTKKSA